MVCVDCHLGMKESEALSSVAAWVDLERSVLRTASQTEGHTQCEATCMWKPETKISDPNHKQKCSLRHGEQRSGSQRGEGGGDERAGGDRLTHRLPLQTK